MKPPLIEPATTTKVDPWLISRALEVAGWLANEAVDVISATAGNQQDGPSAQDSPFDWVTDTGRTLERHTRRVLTEHFPGVGVYGQEFRATTVPPARRKLGVAQYRWVVDPIDGTANYVAGIPWCSYSLALVDEFGPIVGVIADPFHGKIYAAARGRGARVNGTIIDTRKPIELSGSALFLEVNAQPGEEVTQFFDHARHTQTGIRMLGSPALAMAQVATQSAAGAFIQAYQEWDVAAGLAIALESGALVLDHAGHRCHAPSPAQLARGILVTRPEHADVLLSWWQS
jgi:myo-inositol-1(or 4)-monophosphatase